MKKMYITPAVEIHMTQTEQMMALSLLSVDGGQKADKSEVLVKTDNTDWDLWGNNEEEEY